MTMSAASQSNCRNCDLALSEGDAFCSGCGQKVIVDRLSVRESLREFWHAAIHADRSVLVLIRMLLVRPGYVAREYVEGRRKRYFGPYAFLLLMVSIAAAAVAIFGTTMIKLATIGSAPPETIAAAAVGLDAMGTLVQRHLNVFILAETPLLAAFNRLLFAKDRTNFAEHMVLAAYTSGMRSLFTTLFVIPLSAIFHLTGGARDELEIVFLGIWIAYFAWAASQFSHQPRFGGAIKGALAAVFTWAASQIVYSAITMSLVLFYSHR
jgi:uncharacterized protein DUF3667